MGGSVTKQGGSERRCFVLKSLLGKQSEFRVLVGWVNTVDGDGVITNVKGNLNIGGGIFISVTVSGGGFRRNIEPGTLLGRSLFV